MNIKKRLAILGLSLLSVMSLASCDLAKYLSDFANGNTGVPNIEYGSNVMPTNSSTSKVNPSISSVKSSSKSSSSRSSARSSASKVAQEYSVCFVGVFDGVEDKGKKYFIEQTVNGKLTIPSQTKTYVNGYEIEGYYTSPYLSSRFDFNSNITMDYTFIYISYKSIKTTPTTNYFEDLQKQSDCVLAYDFMDFEGMIPDEGTTLGKTEYPRLIANDPYGVSAKSDGLVLFYSNAVFDLGTDNYIPDAKITMCFDVNFEGIGGETFFQLVGYSENKQNTEVFGLRSSSGRLYYRLDAGESNETNINLVVNKTYSFLITLYPSTGELSLTIDDEYSYIVNTKIYLVNGLKFTCKTNSSTVKRVNKVAVVVAK